MIEFDRVGVLYPQASRATLDNVTLSIPDGELCLVVGRTGSGKSTFLRAINGLVPHFTGGTLRGRVTVDGVDTRTNPPRELAHLVGMVGQDPLSGFTTDTVEEELAYAMEQLAIPSATMRKRVEETLDLLGIADLRRRPLRQLSGGQQQRVAIGAVLTAHPRILVLDEPTSALDPTAAEEVLAAVTRLVHDLGVTVVMAEHRLERVVQYADRVLCLNGDGTVRSGPPALMMVTSPVAPPVVEVGRLAGWDPLPLSIRDARKLAPALAARLTVAPFSKQRVNAPTILTAKKIVVRYGEKVAVRNVDLQLPAGQVTALMGRNGSGKSSLLWALQGSGPRHSGSVDTAGRDPQQVPAREARTLVGLVPQTSGDLLYLETVGAECVQADRESAVAEGTCRALLDRLVPAIGDEIHPRDLSEGQRLALVLAIQLAAAPRVLLLDEPTRGLDYPAKHHLAEVIRGLADAGHAIVVATHDVEFVAVAADRVVVMAEGEIVADGATAEVVIASPAFAPQVAKILDPLPLLTVADVRKALT